MAEPNPDVTNGAAADADGATTSPDIQFAPPLPSLDDQLAPPSDQGYSPSVRSGPSVCPHCGAALHAHGGVNAGFFHCNVCGCCLDKNGDQRPDHPVCNIAQARQNAFLVQQAQQGELSATGGGAAKRK